MEAEEVAEELLLVIGIVTNEPYSLHFPIVITVLIISSFSRELIYRAMTALLPRSLIRVESFPRKRNERGKGWEGREVFRGLLRVREISRVAIERRMRLVYRRQSRNALLLNRYRLPDIDLIFL